jgi:hypothetical protein
MKKQTAIDWLFKELLNSEPNILEWNKLLEQAKEMEKEQIKEAYCMGDDNIGAEQYYNETFKSDDKTPF